jgi:hypothetical protein
VPTREKSWYVRCLPRKNLPRHEIGLRGGWCDREDVYAVTVRLIYLVAATYVSGEEIRRLIEMVAEPGDGLEHMYARASARGVDVVMFLIAPGLLTAERVAAQLLARAERAGLAGCWPVSCQVELIVPLAEAALPPDPSPEGPAL